MRADAAACDGSRASHEGLAEGYDRMIAEARADPAQALPAGTIEK